MTCAVRVREYRGHVIVNPVPKPVRMTPEAARRLAARLCLYASAATGARPGRTLGPHPRYSDAQRGEMRRQYDLDEQVVDIAAHFGCSPATVIKHCRARGPLRSEVRRAQA